METVTREQLADALRDLEAALESMRIGPDKAMYSNSVMAKRLAASKLISRFDAERNQSPPLPTPPPCRRIKEGSEYPEKG